MHECFRVNFDIDTNNAMRCDAKMDGASVASRWLLAVCFLLLWSAPCRIQLVSSSFPKDVTFESSGTNSIHFSGLVSSIDETTLVTTIESDVPVSLQRAPEKRDALYPLSDSVFFIIVKSNCQESIPDPQVDFAVDAGDSNLISISAASASIRQIDTFLPSSSFQLNTPTCVNTGTNTDTSGGASIASSIVTSLLLAGTFTSFLGAGLHTSHNLLLVGAAAIVTLRASLASSSEKITQRALQEEEECTVNVEILFNGCFQSLQVKAPSIQLLDYVPDSSCVNPISFSEQDISVEDAFAEYVTTLDTGSFHVRHAEYDRCNNKSASTSALAPSLQPSPAPSAVTPAPVEPAVPTVAPVAITPPPTTAMPSTPPTIDLTDLAVEVFQELGYVRVVNLDTPVVFKGLLFFRANDGVNGVEPWVSDGTPEGTKMFMDINPGSDGSWPSYYTVFNNVLIFGADDGVHGQEPWISDGTVAGTKLLEDINPTRIEGGDSLNLPSFFQVNDKMYFRARDGTSRAELWVTDGTEAGTTMVKDIHPDGASVPGNFAALNGRFFFTAFDETGYGFWSTDGSEAGTTVVTRALRGIQHVTTFKDKLYFSANDGEHGAELFVSDGTEDGTRLVKDINPEDMDGSSPRAFAELNGILYFGAGAFPDLDLWQTDGTEQGTKTTLPSGTVAARRMTTVNDRLYFSGNGQPWISDGTPQGTRLIKELNAFRGVDPKFFIAVKDKVFFSADDDLFVTDGTEEGTVEIDNRLFDDPVNLIEFNGNLYFHASYVQNGDEVYGLLRVVA